MSTSTAPSVRCPRCSAHLRAGSEWCSLCFADLRPEPVAPTPVPRVERAEEAGPAEVRPASAETRAAPRRGKHARRDSSYGGTPSPDDVEVLAQQMLAELAATERRDPLGPLAGIVDSTPKKVGVMVGGAVGAMCLLFLVMAVLGALF